jgi:hypothetical protein
VNYSRAAPRISEGGKFGVGFPDAPDSPVNYGRAAPRISEGGKFGVGFPDAPDSPVRQTRAAFGCLLLSLFELFLGFFIGFC